MKEEEEKEEEVTEEGELTALGEEKPAMWYDGMKLTNDEGWFGKKLWLKFLERSANKEGKTEPPKANAWLRKTLHRIAPKEHERTEEELVEFQQLMKDIDTVYYDMASKGGKEWGREARILKSAELKDFLSDEDHKKYRFDHLDDDNSGNVTLVEFRQHLEVEAAHEGRMDSRVGDTWLKDIIASMEAKVEELHGGFKVDMGPVGEETDYDIIKCPGESVGAILGQPEDGFTTIEAAVSIAIKRGYVPGDSVRYIQSVEGNTYFYAAGDESGESGQETWKLDPKAKEAKEVKEAKEAK